ncbi:trypsin-like serine peptidase [Nonomuraea sp. NPDC003201]
MHRRVVLLSAVALALAGALVPAGAAQASAPSGLGPRPVGWSGADSWSERRSVLQYWTPQRMLAAQPLGDPPPRRGQSSGPTEGSPWASRNGSVQRSSWSTGSGAATRGAAWSVAGTQAVNQRLQAVVPNSPGLRWTDGGAIVRTTGRVFFTTAEGGNASCSGSAVTSANESVVMTAGHCVKMNGAAHRNWVFVPGFDNGRRPFGTWVATSLLTTQQWNANEDINFDVAAAVVAPLQGQTLTDVVGGQGIAFNQPRGRQMFSFGYPAAAPFDGSRLIYCSGRTFNDTVQTRDQGLRCNMTGGSSGGPWFQGFNESTGLGWLNSVNSFKYDFAPQFMFGPFFGNEAMAVYQSAQRANAA